MFKKGDYVVKPNTGICEIEDIAMMSLTDDDEKEYYVLQPLVDHRSKLYVSVDADRRRLRMAMNASEAADFIEKIAEIAVAKIENEKLREQSYKNAFLSNEPEELVAIIKNMHIRARERFAQGKKTTATDERYFQQAENILYNELGIALGVTKEEIKVMVSEHIQYA